MSKELKSVVLPISLKRDMYDYVNNLVTKGRYATKAEFIKKAILEKMKRDNKSRFLCDFCHKKFKRTDNPVISIEHTSEGIAVGKVHKRCSKRNSVFEGVSEGAQASA